MSGLGPSRNEEEIILDSVLISNEKTSAACYNENGMKDDRSEELQMKGLIAQKIEMTLWVR